MAGGEAKEVEESQVESSTENVKEGDLKKKLICPECQTTQTKKKAQL